MRQIRQETAVVVESILRERVQQLVFARAQAQYVDRALDISVALEMRASTTQGTQQMVEATKRRETKKKGKMARKKRNRGRREEGAKQNVSPGKERRSWKKKDSSTK